MNQEPEIVKEFSVWPKGSLTIDTSDYDGNDFDLKITEVHKNRAQVKTDSREVNGKAKTIYYIRNFADSPIFVKLVRKNG